MKSLISNNSKRAQKLFLKLYKTIHFNAIYIIEVFTKYGNFLAKTYIEARGVVELWIYYLDELHLSLHLSVCVTLTCVPFMCLIYHCHN